MFNREAYMRQAMRDARKGMQQNSILEMAHMEASGGALLGGELFEDNESNFRAFASAFKKSIAGKKVADKILKEYWMLPDEQQLELLNKAIKKAYYDGRATAIIKDTFGDPKYFDKEDFNVDTLYNQNKKNQRGRDSARLLRLQGWSADDPIAAGRRRRRRSSSKSSRKSRSSSKSSRKSRKSTSSRKSRKSHKRKPATGGRRRRSHSRRR